MTATAARTTNWVRRETNSRPQPRRTFRRMAAALAVTVATTAVSVGVLASSAPPIAKGFFAVIGFAAAMSAAAILNLFGEDDD